MAEKILIVDDEPALRLGLQELLNIEGYDISTAPSAAAALERVAQSPPDLILCDMKMPKTAGVEVLKKAAELSPPTLVIMMTAFGDVKDAVECMKLGAYDYIQKPFDNDAIRLTVRKALDYKKLKDEVQDLKKKIAENALFPDIVCKNKKMGELLETVTKIAKYDTTVLISGETGTGKELVAKAIHRESSRKTAPFIIVNCGAIPPTLIESELFGFVKGAFTDARFSKKGLLEEAEGGTVFLDELGELPSNAQVALLRFLQEGEVKKLGDTETKKLDVRVICATNKNLSDEIRAERFREDLYYRVSVATLHIPPLRERMEDIPPLAFHFLELHSKKMKKQIQTISPEALMAFLSYPWPGNVRELENEMERAALLEDGNALSLYSLSDKLKTSNTHDLQEKEDMAKGLDLNQYLEDIEKTMIEDVLKKCKGNITVAAKTLGLKRTTLQDKVLKYGFKAAPEANGMTNG